MNIFLPADILIPDVESMEKWSVIACDQFSSQPEYWKDVKETVGDAPVELPHVLLLCDDRSDGLMKWLSGKKEEMRKIYNFNLMKEGGHISGWLVSGKLAKDFEKKITSYENIGVAEMPYAVGDGNHSMATAKVCYENYKKTHSDTENANAPARYAMVELENIHDEALKFSPIHRIVTETDEEALLEELQKTCCAPEGYPVQWYTKERQGVLYLNPNKSRLAVAILQRFLDEYLKNHRGKMDYIHGEEALKNLAEKENAVGFLLPAMEKRELFPYVTESGTLPRKTFSMGHATEKRYYLEARQIR